jgi:hypothetical protein
MRGRPTIYIRRPIMAENTPPNSPITWHTAFRDGIQLTFLPYRDVLSFEFEYPLNTEPLRIDAVIIKKRPKAVIDSPLGAIFRKVNIVEYKSPGHSLSLADYDKVGAYARLYNVLKNVGLKNMTITFVAEAYPRKLIVSLKETFGYEVTEKWPGIYYLAGGELGGVQIVETKKLREEDGGVWLRDLRGDLKREELRGIMERGWGMPEGTPLAAYLYIVFQANSAEVEEVVEMPRTKKITFEEVLEKHGYIAKWEARARDKSLETVAKNALAKGMSPETISEITGLDIKMVKKLAKESVSVV